MLKMFKMLKIRTYRNQSVDFGLTNPPADFYVNI